MTSPALNSLTAKDRLALLEGQVVTLTANVEAFAKTINDFEAVQQTHEDELFDDGEARLAGIEKSAEELKSLQGLAHNDFHTRLLSLRSENQRINERLDDRWWWQFWK